MIKFAANLSALLFSIWLIVMVFGAAFAIIAETLLRN